MDTLFSTTCASLTLMSDEKVNTNVDNGSDSDEEVIFISLGDGDFTWSLDFGRYLLSTTTVTNCRLIATGIDSEEEVAYKYRHYSTLVEREWQRLEHQAIATATKTFAVEKRHGINALVQPASSLDNTPIPPGHVVFFHHPHLGTENAALHAQFLSHLLHSVAQYWLQQRQRPCPGRPLSATTSTPPICAVFYLTLVDGQWERWNGPQAARRHGLILIERLTFVPSPVLAAVSSDNDKQPRSTTTKSTTTTLYYEHRRHQTGKSFAARAKGGSETLVFVRQQDADFAYGNRQSIGRLGDRMALPWFVPKSSGTVTTSVDQPDGSLPGVVDESSKPSSPLPFPCPYCPKSFREARSLTNHVQSKHSSAKATDATGSATDIDNDDRKRKHHESDSDETVTPLVCAYCEAQAAPNTTTNAATTRRARTFDSLSALQAHITAKHTALHATIPPDNDSSSTVAQQENGPLADGLDSFGSCAICGHVFVSALDQTNHEAAFVPVPSLSWCEKASTHHCRFCDKAFRQSRAVLQHENFCALRHDTDQSLSSTASVDPIRGNVSSAAAQELQAPSTTHRHELKLR
jgi:Domain of unknown function (DUF2431)/Zinc finger, C2H2 type